MLLDINFSLDIQNKIWINAGLEFEAIWAEHVRTGLPRAFLTDAISKRINDLNDSVSAYVFLQKSSQFFFTLCNFIFLSFLLELIKINR